MTVGARRGAGAERANYQMFLSELCEALDLPRPDPASNDTANNDYVFERGVKRRESEGLNSTLRIDLYKKGAFILEAKQSRASQRIGGGDDGHPSLFKADETASTAATEGKWDVLMRNARKQAEDYVFRLPSDHPAPALHRRLRRRLCVRGLCRLFRSGRAYSHFPDRKGFRIRLEDLRDPEIVKRLKAIWTDPSSLDPTRESARVTRQIAERLAAVSRRLERNHPPEEVAHFLMRCIFTMFAEDVDLLPKGKFTELLEECLNGPDSFAPLLLDLWKRMDDPIYDNRFFSGFKTHLRHFNGGLFHNPRAFPMTREEIGELLAASKHDWRYVEPAIFGTLVEQALEPSERRKLGAHYTPRSYVERLVEVTVMEPLRADWNAALVKAADAKERGDETAAREPSREGKQLLAEAARIAAAEPIHAFHHALCSTRVLDPACGTGNFLYVSLELMKRLEGEVLEALAQLGETERLGEEVDPHQFLGIELNVRAAAIAELVLWIGYLQQHYRNRSEHPAEPILKAFGNIQQKDAVLTWDGYPELQFEMQDGVAVQVYPNARRPDWPLAEFIVGNPPFIGNKRMRDRLGADYVDALREAQQSVPSSVDLVMFWVDRAAELLKRGKLRRFGLVTTNSITQPLNRGPIEEMLSGKTPASVIFAVPDHPWINTAEGAAVRVSMIVGEKGVSDGRLVSIDTASDRRDNSEVLGYSQQFGKIAANLTVGADPSSATSLSANRAVSHQGVILVGEGFRLTPAERRVLVADDEALRPMLRPYLIGQDLMGVPQARYVIDVNDLDETRLRREVPRLYGVLAERVRPDRLKNNDKTFRTFWWRYGRPRPEIAQLVQGQHRYIGTCRTARHRVFVFLDAAIVPDAKIIFVGMSSAEHLAVLSSHIHTHWAIKAGAWLGVGNDSNYNHSKVFDPFPFPDPDEATRAILRDLGEELDATRKTVKAEHPDLTLTGLYNVLEKVRAGTPLDAKDEDVKDRGRVLILKDLHDQIDRATADAYGWPHDLTDEQILERLVALNAERAAEEAAGHVRWLRPDYQIPRFAKGAALPKSGQLDLQDKVVAIDKSLPAFPKDKGEQVMAIRAVLVSSGRPMDAAAVSRAFKRGGKGIEQRVVQALNTLVRYAEITALPGGAFAAKKAA